MIYTREIAASVIKYLLDRGVKVTLFGSVATIGFSTNDMDFLLDNPYDMTIIITIPAKEVIFTDWNGVFLRDTEFGNLDFFPSIPR